MAGVRGTSKTLLAAACLAFVVPPATFAEAPGPVTHPGLRCLVQAYPKHLCGAQGNTLTWCDGTTMTFDDGKTKDGFRARLDGADLEDQMWQRYPVGEVFPKPPPVDFDPGRIRYEPFFEKLYGGSEQAVRKTLTKVAWLPKTLRGDKKRFVKVTRVADVHERLEAVVAELDELPKHLKKFVLKPSGTFNWRKIRGTERKSMHSFAVAIDVGVAYSDYWKWNKPDEAGRYGYKNRFPWEIAEIFERHGFIWGGKWYHFDTMHFEYRPELLADPCVDRAADGVHRTLGSAP